MAPTTPRLRILSVGGNSVSAFLSWRLQATNACDVTLVWKSGFDQVSQYGISFKSKLFGNERFKPLHVVRAPEDAAGSRKTGFDYVLLCIKALPDVYDLAGVIESVVSPNHTCILVNTTHSIGIEAHLEERFPTNVVLSLVSGVDITQQGVSDFEHVGSSTDVWVGPANKNPSIPSSIQTDMAEALKMTLNTGQVDCKVSPNIRQQQFERMIGPVAFHPASVLFETPSHAELIEKLGVRPMITEVMEEMIQVAGTSGCTFSDDFKDQTIRSMLRPTETNSIMYQDFIARRPMEVETYLGAPLKLARTSNVSVPRIETLYALLHNFNVLNQTRPPPSTSPVGGAPPPANPPPRVSSASYPRPPMNGMGPGRGGGRTGSFGGPPPGRRGPPPMNGGGYSGRPPPNGYGRGPPPPNLSRRPSFEGNDLAEEFSHVVLYDDIPEGEVVPGYDAGPMSSSPSDIGLRERELALRQRELAIREQEFNMRRGPRRPPPSQRGGYDDEDDEDYFDPMSARGPGPQVDADNFDMMSVTSRRNRKTPSAMQFRKNPDGMGGGGGGRGSSFFGGPRFAGRNRTSNSIMADVPTPGDTLLANPMMGYSSNRYGAVDRKAMADESRANSLTRERLAQLQGANMAGMNGAYPQPRRTSLSPGDPFNGGGAGSSAGRRTSGRPSPPGAGGLGGMDGGPYPPGPSPGQPPNNRPSPPGMMRQPVPRHPPGQGNMVAPQQVEQQAGVSKQAPPPPLPPHHSSSSPYPPPPPHHSTSFKGGPAAPSHQSSLQPQLQKRSLTGSASASAGSGESALLDSENSAHSSQSSFAPRPPIGVR